MDANTELFLNILRTALAGGRFTPAPDVTAEQWQSLLQLAAIHKLEPLIFEAVHASGAIQAADPALAASLKRQVRQQVILQTMRTAEFLSLNAALREAGVETIVVKGITCRCLYPSPDHRPSADEDVLIRPEDFDRCREILANFGLQTELSEEEARETYEVPYRKSGNPLYIELHKHLFPEASGAYGDLNRFFTDVFDRRIEAQVPGGTVGTMDPTDHLFYLICHSFKHFLHSGFGIRQVCDLALFANRWGSQIDWERVLENCRAIRAERFAAALFAIGSKHLTFDPDRACWSESWRAIAVDEDAMLEDILRAGVYGSADLSRLHSSSITLDAVAAQKEGRRSGSALLTSAFPPAKKLQGRYPWLKKHPYLLPAAWADRLVHYSKEVAASSDSSAAEALKLGSERIALLKQYGIIE